MATDFSRLFDSTNTPEYRRRHKISSGHRSPNPRNKRTVVKQEPEPTVSSKPVSTVEPATSLGYSVVRSKPFARRRNSGGGYQVARKELDRKIIKSLIHENSKLLVSNSKMLDQAKDENTKSFLVAKMKTIAKELDDLERLSKSL